MTEPAPAPAAAPAPAPAPAPTSAPIGVPVTPLEFSSAEAVAARVTIKERIADREFGKKLLAKDPAAYAEWKGLHAKAYPAPTAVTSQGDVNAQTAARNAEMWDGYVQALKQRSPLTAEQEAEIRSGVVPEAVYEKAVEEKNRLVRDKAFYRRLLDGDRQANRDWTLLTSILSLRPVKK